jgi:hypothetical protein
MRLEADKSQASPGFLSRCPSCWRAGQVEPLREYREEHLGVSAADVLADLQSGGRSWEAHVPEAVVALIKQRRLFGCSG